MAKLIIKTGFRANTRHHFPTTNDNKRKKSIDGVVIQDRCIKKLVEFKCPISCQKKAIVDFESELCNVQYLEFVNGNIELKKKHSYYTQIQVQNIYVTGMTMCDIFVYSPVGNGSCTVRVDRDENFMKNAILKSEEFNFNHYLPHLYVMINQYNENNNKQILPKRTFTGNKSMKNYKVR